MRRVVLVIACMVGGILAACDGEFPIPSDLLPNVNPFNPVTDANPLTVDVGEDLFASEDDTLTLTATVTGGVPPYVYRWNVELVPDDPEELLDGVIPLLADSDRPEIETAPFDVGLYVYRVRVTDATGRTAYDYVQIDVGPTPLRVTIAEAGDNQDEPLTAIAAEPFTLTADTNMTGEFTYNWAQLSGPDVELSATDERSVDVTATAPGEVVIRITVSEAEGATAFRNVTINVEQGDAFLVRIDRPDLLLLDQAATVTANITNDAIDADTLSYDWTVVKGDVRIATPDTRTTQITAGVLDTVGLRVTATGTINGRVREDTEEVFLVVLPDLHPRFIMTVTSLNDGVSGMITFEFDAESAPKTTANIVRYIDEGFYNNVVWHRVASSADGPFVAQFGGFTREQDVLTAREPTFDPVESENEGTIGNTLGNIGLALTGTDVNSGTTQIFVNMTDNSFLDDRGFTAFGTVVEGFERIEAMFDAELDSEESDDGLSLRDVPVEDITILNFRREQVSEADRPDGSPPGAFSDNEGDMTGSVVEEMNDGGGGR